MGVFTSWCFMIFLFLYFSKQCFASEDDSRHRRASTEDDSGCGSHKFLSDLNGMVSYSVVNTSLLVPSATCSWKITVPEEYSIFLNSTQMARTYGRCSYGELVVYDSEDQRHIVGKVCGGSANSSMYSSSNTVYMTFTFPPGPSLRLTRGFNITWNAVYPSLLFDCTFDWDVCGWSNKYTGSRQVWQWRGRGNYHSRIGRGQYMYTAFTSSSSNSANKPTLISSTVTPGGEKCLRFFYTMIGSSSNKKLTVLVKDTTGQNQIWTVNGINYDVWIPVGIAVKRSSRPFQVIFEAFGPNNTRPRSGEIGIDDVTIRDGPCPPVVRSFNCTFDKYLCGWVQDTTDDINWKRQSGGTSTSNTGPAADYTTGDSSLGYYLYLEATGLARGKKARLISPEVTVNTTKCVQFFYHMYGAHIGSLKVMLNDTKSQTLGPAVWTKNGNQGNVWLRGQLNITRKTTPVRVVITAERGIDYEGDIAIDHVSIFDGICRPPSISFNCTFDEGPCGWEHKPAMRFYWNVNRGKTPSSDTGPLQDHTSGQGSYLYIEVSNVAKGRTAQIFSPKVESDGGPMCLNFFYHMHGSNIGSLKAHLSVGNWTATMWEKYGQQGNAWKLGSVDISGFTKFQVIFLGVAGSGYAGDIAIDDVTISNGQCANRTISFNCTFGVNDCGWTLGTPQGKWKRVPISSNSNGFAIGREQDCSSNRIYLTSPDVNPVGPTQCIRFYYRMSGQTQSMLKVYLNTAQNSPYWSNATNDTWTEGRIEINSTAAFKVLFEAVCVGSKSGNQPDVVMIDDVLVLNETCYKPPPNMNCTFDKDLCSYEQDKTDNFDWTRQRGGTPSSDTGPDRDHTSGNGYYMYIEATSKTRGWKANLILRNMPGGSPRCLQFYYSMRGKDIGALKVSTNTSLSRRVIWSKSGNIGRGWRLGKVVLQESRPFDVTFSATRGNDYAGDIAIDDIALTESGLCPPDSQEFNCTFESGECGWSQGSTTDQFDWVLHQGSTPTSSTGPSRDHTTGRGFYMYIEASSASSGAKADFISPKISPKGLSCVLFYYHMYGSKIGSLKVFTKTTGSSTTKLVWAKSGAQGNLWKNGFIELTASSSPLQVIFQAIRGTDYEADIAIDDVSIVDGPCPEVVRIFNCTFDAGDCGWFQDPKDQFDWTNRRGSTPTSSTGPSRDHTSGSGSYMYIEASSIAIGAKARLTSPAINTTIPSCLNFFYHMHGNHIGSLIVYVKDKQNVSTQVWGKEKAQGNAWQLGAVNISKPSPYQIIFEGIRGRDYEGDIAIDDVSMANGFCPPIPYAFNCTFEVNMCGWRQETRPFKDTFDWTRHKGSTPSTSTGPSKDHTTNTHSGYYMYIETSSGHKGSKAHLLSPNMTYNGQVVCLDFYYHMYGGHIGTLNVNVTTARGRRYNIWSHTGPRGNKWKHGAAEINETESFQIIFEGIRGRDFEGDIAIDDIRMLEKPCPPGFVTPPPTPPPPTVPANQLPYNCGGLTILSGHDKFRANFPTSPMNLNCSWLILVPSGKGVRLHVDRVFVGANTGTSCFYRSLRLYEKGLTRLGEYCGQSSFPVKIDSKADMILIRYRENRIGLGGYSSSLLFNWKAVDGNLKAQSQNGNGTYLGAERLEDRSWVVGVVGVVLFLVLLTIVIIVVILLMSRRNMACFSRKSGADAKCIGMTEMRTGRSFFGGRNYARLGDDAMTDLRDWLQSQGVTGMTYQTLVREGFYVPKMFALLTPDDVGKLPIKQYAQVLLLKKLVREFHEQDDQDEADVEDSADPSTAKEKDLNKNQNTGL